MKESYKFWQKYIKANELDRHKLIGTLPIMKGASRETGGLVTFISATLLQDYFDDLIEALDTVKGGK